MFKKILFALFVLFIAVNVSFAGDLFNIGAVYNGNARAVPSTGNVVAYWENYTQVTYMFRCTYVDSSDSYHSKPLYIGDCNASDGYVYSVQSAAGDVNVLYKFSYDDRNTWITVTPADLDAVSNTAKQDTIGIEKAVDDIKGFHAAQWLIIEADGQTGNADDNIFTIVISLTKDQVAVKPNGDYVSVARVTSKYNTAP